jgi:hypothetical protein
MRKISLQVLSLLFCAFASHSQDSLIFKVQYNPETNYAQTMEQTTHSNIKYSGSEEFLQNIKAKGIQNPTITNKKSTIETLFKTGKLTNKANFPLTIEFTKTTSSDGKQEIPNGTLIYGHGSINTMPSLDSIVSNGLEEELKQVVLQTMQSTFSQLSFPEKRVKVGDSFSIDSPLSIPIAGATLDMTITTDYKLLSITNGIANLDISQVYTMKTTITDQTIQGTGTGNGKLLYDTVKNYYLNYQINTEMNMTMKLDSFSLDLTSKSGFIQSTVITKNKQ